MAKTCKKAELCSSHWSGIPLEINENTSFDPSVMLAMQAAQMAKSSSINTIVIITKNGITPKRVSRYKPNAFIFAVSNNKEAI